MRPDHTPTSDADVSHTVRHAGLVLVQRVLHVVLAACTALLVPRLMGPDAFGRFMLLSAVSMWFAQLSGMGAVSLLTRTAPAFVAANDLAGLRKLITSLVALRGLTGVLSATLYAALVTIAFGVSDLTSVLLMAAAVCGRTVGNVCFALFLGLNQAARWGAGDLLRRWLILIFVLVGVPLGGLRGACAGVLAANVVVLGVGLWLARPYLVWNQIDLSRRYLAPFLRVGTAFAAGSLLLALTQHSGESIVRTSGLDFAEVGYFGAAYGIYLTIAHAIWQVAIAFAPHLVAEMHAGRSDVVLRWLERLLTWMIVAAAPLIAGAAAFGGDLVPIVLGPAYGPVAVNLVPVMLALVTLAVGSVGRLAGLVLDRPGAAVAAGALQLGAFWVLGLLLAPAWGSFGVALAVLPASGLYAILITWAVRRDLAYGWRLPATAAGLAAIFVPVVVVPMPVVARAGAFALAVALYGWLLWKGRVITRGEVSAWRHLVRRSGVEAPDSAGARGARASDPSH